MTLLGESAPAQAAETARWPARLWHAPLGAHLLVLALLLAGLLPFLTPRGTFSSDEGAYATQVKALEDGRWAYDYKARPYDPEGVYFPIVNSDSDGTDFFTYVKQPAYPLLLRAATRVLSETAGLHLFSLVGVLLTAAAAWLLARELDPALSRPAFWLAAAGPVLVNGYLLWAHALIAGVAGLTLVAAVRVARTGLRPWPAVALAAGLSACGLLRAEGLLFAGAVTAALAWTALRRRGVRAGLTTAVAVGAVPLTVALLERIWVATILDGGTSPGAVVRGGSETSYFVGRITGAWHSLFAGGYGTAVGSTLGILALALLVGLGGLALRRGAHQEFTMACALAVVVLGLRLIVAQDEPVTGLFAAWPVALLGLLLVRWRGSAPEVRTLGVVAALFGAAVLATQYPEGGGLEWGGRFFAPLTAAVAMLAVHGLRGRVSTAATVAVAAATAVFALSTVGWARMRDDRIIDAVARNPAPVTVTTVESLPRVAWRLHDDTAWMLVPHEKLVTVLNDLRAAGVDRVAVITGDRVELAGATAYPVAEPRPYRELNARHGQLVMLFG